MLERLVFTTVMALLVLAAMANHDAELAEAGIDTLRQYLRR